MPRVVWTEEAEAQLAEVSADEMAEELLALAGGLSRFPERGRRVPELRTHPAYDPVREIILPHRARVFYLHIPDSDEIIILGLLTRGRLFHSKILGHYFDES
jgi:plasmid stabilization system protein ParE